MTLKEKATKELGLVIFNLKLFEILQCFCGHPVLSVTVISKFHINVTQE